MGEVTAENVLVATTAMAEARARYTSHLTAAIAVFVPQLGVLGLLLITTTRVGPFYPLASFLFVSDSLTVYFAAIALVDLWLVRWQERFLIDQNLFLRLDSITEAPGFVRKFSRTYDRYHLNTSFRIGFALFWLAAFVVGVSTYVGWLWFNP